MGPKTRKIDRAKIALLALGVLAWSSTMFKSGLIYSFGMGFWGPNGHDGVWHIALAKRLSQGSFEMPVFAGEAIKNYHVGFDLLLALLHKITSIPVRNLYFQIIPPILALLIGVLTYKFVKDWRKSRLQAWWATFFVYFAGSFGWIVTLLRSGRIDGESMFWAQQSLSTLINPPYALSLVLFLAGLICLVKLTNKYSTKRLFLASVFFGLMLPIKVYGGLLAIGGLGAASTLRYLKERKLDIAKVFGLSLTISLALFLPFNRQAGGLVVFKPFWFLETMMGLSDRLYWPRYESALLNYKLAGNLVKGIPAYLFAFVIFWIGNLGTRVMKGFEVFGWVKDYKKLGYLRAFLISVIAAGVLVPTFFLQKGTPWNTIQFIYYSLFFSGIIAGIAFGRWLEKAKKSKSFMASFALLAFSLPTAIATLRHYLPKNPPSVLYFEELSALNFLSSLEDGVVLSYPYDDEVKKGEAPVPLYRYVSTAYVSAFSGKRVYLEDEVNLDIMNYSWKERKKKVLGFLSTQDEKEARNFLKDANISYVYWLKGQRAVLGESQLGIDKIFENDKVNIYKVED